MAFAIGTHLGVYEITGLIGVGGMGEVYRATDTKLGRSVAIKTLPSDLAKDADRLARFEREAKLLAALNHAHIAGVHGLHEHEGTQFLAMELVEGETLERKLRDAAMPVEDALRLALQIAEALEAAHEKGVMHRDLKPANVMVTNDGAVKVLDFGLAKAFAGDPNEASPAHSPALSLAMTQRGLILGTAGYMSPEQASGQATDQRADVWAFGVVLFEMLTGAPLFSGESVPHILADVLRTEPDWTRLPKNLHPRVKLLLKRCLVKKVRNRYHSIADVRVDLESILNDPGGAEARAETHEAAPALSLAKRLAAAIALVAIGVLAGIAAWSLKPGAPTVPRPTIRVAHALPEGQAFLNLGGSHEIAISPDGRRFIYNTSEGLALREMDALEAVIIRGTEGGLRNPAFSPDGESIVFQQEGQLRRIAVGGGASVPLTQTAPTISVRWEADGTILYVQGGQAGGIWQVSEKGGEPEQLIADETATVIVNPQRLPGGDWVLYTTNRFDQVRLNPSFEDSRITLESLSSRERRVVRMGADARFVPTGHLVYASDGVIYAMPFDIDRLEATGGPVPVVEGVAAVVPGLYQFDFSQTGDLVYIPGPARAAAAQFALGTAPRAGGMTRIGTPAGRYGHVRASPDGTRLAVDTDDGNDAIVWIYDVDGTSTLRRLTFEGRNRLPVWSPDGLRVAFSSDRGGAPGIYVQPVDGAGEAQRLTTAGEGEVHIPESWSPDGKHLSFSVVKDGGWTLFVLSLDDGTAQPFGEVQSIEPIGSVFSPDGRWIAYHALPRGALQTTTSSGVYVQPFPATGARYQAPKVSRDFQPVWSRDGTELFYIASAASRRLAAVPVSAGSGISFGAPALAPFELFADRLSGGTRAFDTLPDGRFVGIAADAAAGTADAAIAPQVRIVVNWFEELKRLAPTE